MIAPAVALPPTAVVVRVRALALMSGLRVIPPSRPVKVRVPRPPKPPKVRVPRPPKPPKPPREPRIRIPRAERPPKAPRVVMAKVPKPPKPPRVRVLKVRAERRRAKCPRPVMVRTVAQEPPPVPDAELVARAQAGDRSAFDVLYCRYSPRLTRRVREWMRSPVGDESASDVVADTFERAYRKLHLYRPVVGRPWYAWLSRILRNCFIDYVRRERRHIAESLDAIGDDGEGGKTWTYADAIADPAAARELAWAESRADWPVMRDALLALPTRQRLILTQRFVYDRSVLETAAALGVSREAVLSSTLHAMRKLREQFANGTMKGTEA